MLIYIWKHPVKISERFDIQVNDFFLPRVKMSEKSGEDAQTLMTEKGYILKQIGVNIFNIIPCLK